MQSSGCGQDEDDNALQPPKPPTITTKLHCRIPSDIIELDKIHTTHQFVPNSKQVRPTDEMKVIKSTTLQDITQDYRNFEDYIYHTVFDCPIIKADDGKNVVANRHRMRVQRENKKVFQPQMFPY